MKRSPTELDRLKGPVQHDVSSGVASQTSNHIERPRLWLEPAAASRVRAAGGRRPVPLDVESVGNRAASPVDQNAAL